MGSGGYKEFPARVTLRLNSRQLKELDRLAKALKAPSASEVIRNLIDGSHKAHLEKRKTAAHLRKATIAAKPTKADKATFAPDVRKIDQNLARKLKRRNRAKTALSPDEVRRFEGPIKKKLKREKRTPKARPVHTPEN